MSQVYVYDRRQFPYFQVDNALIEVYGRHIGAYAIAVYNCLACHANREMIAFPSYERIGKETGTSRSTAMRAVKKLIEWNIIQLIEEDRHRPGTREFENNRYLLTPQSEWKPAPVLTETSGVREIPHIPEKSGGVSQESQVVSERTRGGVRETHKQEPVQQDQINKNQQQQIVEAAPVVEVAYAPSNGVPPEVEALAVKLHQAGYVPKSAALSAATKAPELSAAWLSHLQSTPNLKNPGGFLRQRIAGGEFPPGYEAEPEAPKPKRISPAKKREKFAAAYDAVWNSLTEKLRAMLEAEGKDRYEFIEKHKADDLALAIRQNAQK